MRKHERKYDSYLTYTPPEEVAICEHCPYPKPKCGEKGCKHFQEKKAAILAKKNDKRRFRKENLERIKKERYKV